MRLETFDAASANRLLAEMRAEAEAIVRRAAPAAALQEQRSAFMRYRGQGHEIAVSLPLREFTPADRSSIRDLFEAAYRRLYSRAIPGVEIEILELGRRGERPSGRPSRRPGRRAAEQPETALRGGRSSTRRPLSSGTWTFIGGRNLAPGARISGPAVIAEDETSTVVSARFDARIDRFGYIELVRKEA